MSVAVEQTNKYCTIW